MLPWWRSFFATAACAATLWFPLRAEIESVMIRWYDPMRCSEGCAENIARQLRRVEGAAEVWIDGPAGSAMLRWKPRSMFRYFDVYFAVRTVGANPLDLRLSVRGTIVHTGGQVLIKSLGDDTSFILVSPLDLRPNQTTVPDSIFAYSLQPDTRRQLLEAEMAYRVVTISGKLVMPLQTPSYLVIQSLAGTQNIAPSSGRKAR